MSQAGERDIETPLWRTIRPLQHVVKKGQVVTALCFALKFWHGNTCNLKPESQAMEF
jgi:hypothetical protein